MKKKLLSAILLAFATTSAFALTDGTTHLISHKETNSLPGKVVFQETAKPSTANMRLQKQIKKTSKDDLNVFLVTGDDIDSTGQFVGYRSLSVSNDSSKFHFLDAKSELCLYKEVDSDQMETVGCADSEDGYSMEGDYFAANNAVKYKHEFKEAGTYLLIMTSSTKVDNDNTRYFTGSTELLHVEIIDGKAVVTKVDQEKLA